MTSSSPPAASGIRRFAVPAHDVLAQAAALIIDTKGPASLRDARVLVPDLHAVADVAQALKAAARVPAMLLPQITTLRVWSEEATIDVPVIGEAARSATLYRVLSQHGWFAGADLWAVSGELGRLFDELTRNRVRLAAAPADFAAWLKQAYGSRGDSALDFEARLVHDTWSAFASDASTLDAESAYVARLARLVTGARAPLHVVAPMRYSRAEQEFLEEYARHAPVYLYAADLAQTADGCARALALAWPPSVTESIKARAGRLQEHYPASVVTARVLLSGATSAEHEAQIVDLAVRERLCAGQQRIAVVVQDRITARRARALLERAGVLVSEEAGWAMSTTSAATVVARWLDALSGNFYYRDLLDLLKSPFVFADWPRTQRQQAVWRLEQRIRSANVVAGLDRYLELAGERDDVEARQMLLALRAAAAPLQRQRATLSQWLDLLLASLDEIGVRAGWTADAAGMQLLDLLEALREELRGEKLTLRYAEWRLWLGAQLDNAAFRDTSVTSPVVFTYLAAAALRRFDAVIIAGVDAAHLPTPDTGSAFFNESVRAQLGLPTRAERNRDAEQSLAELIAGCNDVVLTWQCVRAGERNLLSPMIERFDALHALAYGASLGDGGLARRAVVARVRTGDAAADCAVSAMPAPAIAIALMPAAISASGHNALMACPYQFYARYVLRLAELDEVQELIEKSDYGESVHEALANFHRAHPQVSALQPDHAVRELERYSEAAFAQAVAANYLARAWRERWRQLIPAYLEWQRGREAQGWRVVDSEVARKVEMATPAGRRLELRGRIDRVDRNAAGAVTLVDYKTQRRELLRAKAEADGEDVQLPFYALLWQEPAAEALFLGMERDGVAAHPLKDDVNALAADVRERIGRLYDRLHEGAALPAHGNEGVCQYCEVSGLCRKSHWP